MWSSYRIQCRVGVLLALCCSQRSQCIRRVHSRQEKFTAVWNNIQIEKVIAYCRGTIILTKFSLFHFGNTSLPPSLPRKVMAQTWCKYSDELTIISLTIIFRDVYWFCNIYQESDEDLWRFRLVMLWILTNIICISAISYSTCDPIWI